MLTPIVKRYPPDTNAASLWLRNRHPAMWKERIEHTGGALSLELILSKLDEPKTIEHEPNKSAAIEGFTEKASEVLCHSALPVPAFITLASPNGLPNAIFERLDLALLTPRARGRIP